MTDARGKLGGHVFTKARNGATIRTKVTPANPTTAAQVAARLAFSEISSHWRVLPEAARVAWNNAVSEFSRTNIFGDTYLPSGKNLFVQLNSNLRNVGQVELTLPPPPQEMQGLILSYAALDTAAEKLLLAYAGPEPGAGYSKVIEATRPFSAGKYNFSGSYAKIYSWDAAAEPSSIQAYQDYVAKYGSPNVGTKISFRSSVINNVSGQKSVYSEVTTIVV